MPVTLALVILFGSLLAGLPGSASAHSWGNGCAPTTYAHCYTLAEWSPNAHKHVDAVWSYLTAENVHFGHLPLGEGTATEEPEFVTMETWASWAVPGKIVEEPVNEEVWVEGGMQWSGNPVSCHYFMDDEFFHKELEHQYSVPCESHQNVYVEFDKRSGQGSELTGGQPGENVCVFIDSNIIGCAAGAEEPGALPPGPFTELNTGMEIATGYEPKGFKGKSESHAEGGLEQEWRGRLHAEDWFEEGATCYENLYGEKGSIEFSAGLENCPVADRYGIPGHEREEPCASCAKAFDALPLESRGEADSGPESTGPPPEETRDSFSAFQVSTQPKLNEADIAAEAKTAAIEEGDPIEYVESADRPAREVQPEKGRYMLISQSNKLEKVDGARAEGLTPMMSAHQRKYEEQEVYKVELGDTRESHWFRNAGKSGPWWQSNMSWARYLREIINAKTGEVIEKEWSQTPPTRMAEYQKELHDKEFVKRYRKGSEEREKLERELKEFKAKRKAESKAQKKEEIAERKCAEKPTKCSVQALIARKLRFWPLTVSTNIGGKATVRVKKVNHLIEQHRGRISTRLPRSRYVLSAFAHGYSCEQQFIYLDKVTNVKLKCYRKQTHRVPTGL